MSNPRKQKGNNYEYEVQENLTRIGYTTTRTAERGYTQQYDLYIEEEDGFTAIECKRQKGFTWNTLKGFFMKLEEKQPKAKKHLLFFRGNRQPCLIMSRAQNGTITVQEFKDFYGRDYYNRR